MGRKKSRRWFHSHRCRETGMTKTQQEYQENVLFLLIMCMEDSMEKAMEVSGSRNKSRGRVGMLGMVKGEQWQMNVQREDHVKS